MNWKLKIKLDYKGTLAKDFSAKVELFKLTVREQLYLETKLGVELVNFFSFV